MLLRKKNMHNSINQRYFNHRNRIQGSYNLLITFLAADGGWPPGATFTLVTKVLMCIFKALVSQAHMIAWQNIKKNYLMCQIPIKMLTQHESLHTLNIYSSKGCIKTSQSPKTNYTYLSVVSLTQQF